MDKQKQISGLTSGVYEDYNVNTQLPKGGTMADSKKIYRVSVRSDKHFLKEMEDYIAYIPEMTMARLIRTAVREYIMAHPISVRQDVKEEAKHE